MRFFYVSLSSVRMMDTYTRMIGSNFPEEEHRFLYCDEVGGEDRRLLEYGNLGRGNGFAAPEVSSYHLRGIRRGGLYHLARTDVRRQEGADPAAVPQIYTEVRLGHPGHRPQ